MEAWFTRAIKPQIMRMTDAEFQTIYGEEAERMGGLTGDILNDDLMTTGETLQ